jgi:hypothetical protein
MTVPLISGSHSGSVFLDEGDAWASIRLEKVLCTREYSQKKFDFCCLYMVISWDVLRRIEGARNSLGDLAVLCWLFDGLLPSQKIPENNQHRARL